MSVRSGRLPSAGFVAIVSTLVAVAAFFAWGMAQPPLDRVWEIHHLLKIGKMDHLKGRDRALLGRELIEHRGLARDLLDGHPLGIISASSDGWLGSPSATLLRTPDSAAIRSLDIDVQTPLDLLPVDIVVRGDSWKEERRATGHGVITLALPAPRGGPEIIEILVRGKGLSDDPSVLGIRVTWEDGR
jgi:hypothetical protein